MAVMIASDTSIPVTTGVARPGRQKIASARPPSSAPLVRPRSSNAAFRTKATCRLKEAIKIRAPAQTTVETLLKRKKNASLRRGNACLTKSMVDTEAKDVSAELTEDIAADKMATIKNPFKTWGTFVRMKIGKTKSLAVMREPGRVSGSGIRKGW